MVFPQGYHITFGVYLGRPPGSSRPHVDKDNNEYGQPFALADPELEKWARDNAKFDELELTLDQRQCAEEAIVDLARRYNWTVHSIAIQCDHAHVVISVAREGEQLREAIKAVATRWLNKRFGARKWWAEAGARNVFGNGIISRMLWIMWRSSASIEHLSPPEAEPLGSLLALELDVPYANQMTRECLRQHRAERLRHRGNLDCKYHQHNHMARLRRIPFLTARWSNLALLTYRLDPAILSPLLPPGCELDLIDGSVFASLVAFDFLDTRVLGVRWRGFVDFPEVNLRFYVRHRDVSGEVHRGVAFVRELVPQRFIAWTARRFYNEPYLAAPMKSCVIQDGNSIALEHRVQFGGRGHRLRVDAEAQPYRPAEQSTEHFFKEHEWGFGASKSGRLIRYQVAHPHWDVYPVKSFQLDWGFENMYGPRFALLDAMQPMSVIFAVGSAVSVFPRGSLRGNIPARAVADPAVASVASPGDQ